VDGEVFGDPRGQFELLVDLVQQKIVFLVHHAVTVRTVFGEDLEAYVKPISEKNFPRKENKKRLTSSNTS
jgi:hypothetical protein